MAGKMRQVVETDSVNTIQDVLLLLKLLHSFVMEGVCVFVCIIRMVVRIIGMGRICNTKCSRL